MIIESLPTMMNNIAMMHTIARYYNTPERMTVLFQKVGPHAACQAGTFGLSSPLQMRSSSLRCSCMPHPEPAADPATKWAAAAIMPATQTAVPSNVLLPHEAA